MSKKTEYLLALENASFEEASSIADKLYKSNLKYDKDIAIAILKHFPNYLTMRSVAGGLPDEMKEDDDLKLVAFKANPIDFFSYAPDNIKSDINIVKDVLERSTGTRYETNISAVSPIVSNDPDFWFSQLDKLLRFDFNFVNYMPSILKNDLDFMYKIYKMVKIKGWDMLGYLPTEMKLEVEWREKQESVGKEFKRKFVKIKVGRVTLTIVSQIKKEDIEILNILKKSLFKTIIKIQNSAIPNFDSVLEGTLFAGTHEDIAIIQNRVGAVSTLALGEYFEKTYDVAIYFQKKYSFLSVPTIIHEFAHKYCFALPFSKRLDLNDLFYKAYNSKFCVLAPKPKIGDSLANIASSYLVSSGLEWTQDYERLHIEELMKEQGIDLKEGISNQKKILEGYKLVSISRGGYRYENPEEEDAVVFSGATITRMIKCPSEYPIDLAQKNHPHAFDEWLSEMVTLITLNKVRPSQKKIVSEFIRILK